MVCVWMCGGGELYTCAVVEWWSCIVVYLLSCVFVYCYTCIFRYLYSGIVVELRRRGAAALCMCSVDDGLSDVIVELMNYGVIDV